MLRFYQIYCCLQSDFYFKPTTVHNEAFYYFDPLHHLCKRVYFIYLFVLTLYTIRVQGCFSKDMYSLYKSLKYINDSIYLIRNKKYEEIRDKIIDVIQDRLRYKIYF
jgi:hypothetical protein